MNYYRQTSGRNRSHTPTLGVASLGGSQSNSEYRASADWSTGWPVPRLWQLTARAAALRFVTVMPVDTAPRR
jgi:hypothetical protein